MANFVENEKGIMVRKVSDDEINKVMADDKIKVAVIIRKLATGHEWLEVAKEKIRYNNVTKKATTELLGFRKIEHKLEEKDIVQVLTKDGTPKRRETNSYEVVKVLKGKSLIDDKQIEIKSVSERLLDKDEIKKEVLAEMMKDAGVDNKEDLKARLLGDIPKVPNAANAIEELKEEATALGIRFHPNIGVDKLVAKIEEAKKGE